MAPIPRSDRMISGGDWIQTSTVDTHHQFLKQLVVTKQVLKRRQFAAEGSERATWWFEQNSDLQTL